MIVNLIYANAGVPFVLDAGAPTFFVSLEII